MEHGTGKRNRAATKVVAGIRRGRIVVGTEERVEEEIGIGEGQRRKRNSGKGCCRKKDTGRSSCRDRGKSRGRNRDRGRDREGKGTAAKVAAGIRRG